MIRTAIIFSLLLILPQFAAAQEIGSKGFYSSWKLMNIEEKRQFIAGYKYASEDVQQILDIAIEFVKENPDQAINGLETLKRLYNFSATGPDTLVKEIDRFYSSSSNREASLSRAMTAANNKKQY